VTCSDGINNDTIADPNTTNTFVDCDDFRCCSAGGYIADTCDPSQCP
jgi:hypothetical protein